jgi:hypothetical protein
MYPTWSVDRESILCTLLGIELLSCKNIFDKHFWFQHAGLNMICIPNVDSNDSDSFGFGVNCQPFRFLRSCSSKEFSIAQMAKLNYSAEEKAFNLQSFLLIKPRKVSVLCSGLLNHEIDHVKGFLL